MITVREADAVVEFIPKSERDASQPTVLKFKRLSRTKLAEIRDRMIAMSKKGRIEGIRNESVAVHTVIAMLVGWENVVDSKGKEVKFDSRDQRGMYELLPSSIHEEVERVFGEGSVDWQAKEEKLAAAAESDQSEMAEDDDDEDDSAE